MAMLVCWDLIINNERYVIYRNISFRSITADIIPKYITTTLLTSNELQYGLQSGLIDAHGAFGQVVILGNGHHTLRGDLLQ